MSGPPFTTTPNLGLFKPLYGKDRGAWADHVNANMDTLDQALDTTGGLFLPLTGGVLTGPGNLLVHGNLSIGTLSANVDYGGATPFLLVASATMSGTAPSGGALNGQFGFIVPADTANAGSAARGLSAIPLQYNYGGVGFRGGRTGLNVNMNQTGPITDTPIHGFVGGNFQIFSNQSQSSGTAQMIALSASALLGVGGTGFGFVEALEIGSGSSAPVSGRWGMTIFPLGNQQGNFGNDYAYSVGGIGGGTSTAAFWRAGYTFGRSKSPWGIDPGGSLFTVNTMTTGSDGPQPWLNQTAAFGFNFPQVNFSTAAFWTSGNKVLGDGTHQIGGGALAPIPAGLSIDVVGYVGSAPTISSAGSAYAVGDQVFDAFGGIYVITTVGGPGNITGITLAGGRPPYVYGAPGPATTPLIGGRSTNQDGVIGLTWTQQRALQIQPTAGGLTSFNGATPIAKPTGVAVTAAGIHAALTSLGLIAP